MRAALLVLVLVAGCGFSGTGSLVSDGGPGGASTAPSAEAGTSITGGEGGLLSDGSVDAPIAVIPTLSWSVQTNPPDVDLTALGTLDWAHWGTHADGSPVRKASGGGRIGTYAVTGAACVDSFGPAWTIKASWSDGMPEATQGPTDLHRRYYGTNGLTISLSVPCDGSKHELSVDLGGWSSEARFETSFDNITLSSSLTDNQGNIAGYFAARYTVTYVCPVGTNVGVRWVATNLPAASVCAGSDLILSSAALR